MAATETPAGSVPARGLRRALDVALMVGIAALVLFPILAKLAADRLPTEAPPLLAPLPAGAKPAALRDIPVGLQPSGDLDAAAAALLGERNGARLLELVRDDRVGTPRLGVYPYHYPTLEPLLPATLPTAQATDLGARLILLDPTGQGSAARAAYALLDRARREGACDPSLNVLLLVASDFQPVDDYIFEEGERARRACPGDPTPGWLLGQYQSITALPGMREGESLDAAIGLATLEQLVRDLPGSAAPWAGQADALVRLAAATPARQPWVARHRYERALAGYRRAARLSPGSEVDMGIARALAGLGRADEAAALQQRAVATVSPSPLPQAQLLVYLEAARDFERAAGAAKRLDGLATTAPTGPGLFPEPPTGPSFHEHEGEYGLISLGAGRLAPVSVALDPSPPAPASAGSVEDVSFIPDFRPSPGLTGSDRWCADWARRRDLILAGRPAEALARFPAEFAPLPGHDNSCASGFEPELAAVARLELGDRRSAEATSLNVDDERQNLWRWAGDLARAEHAAREWVAAAPRSPLAVLRLGEIEFLRGSYDAAARDFAAAARRVRERPVPLADDEARALLDRGAALMAAGRREEGEDALREADDIASLAATATMRANDGEPDAVTAALSYYARVQLGEAAREADEPEAAADAYAAARERVPVLKDKDQQFHAEQLENNSAIVDIARHEYESAEAASRRALEVDPENPALLMTAGFAAERAGHEDEAIRLNQAALRADATVYPAANDLGVLLARRGNDDAAVAALRRAVGAESGYALGWFNLGVVLAGMGPTRLLESQGALARAFQLDPELRDREREPTIDAKTYRTGLDVSRPLPPEWTFAASQKHAPAKTVGLAALLLAAFTLSRTLGSRAGRSLAETWLAPVDRATGRMTFLRRLGHPGIAVAATLLVFVAPLARDPSGGMTAAVAGVLGLCLLLAVALRGRSLAGGDRQRTWPPGLLFGLGGAAAGVAWAPLPVLGEKASPRMHWAAPAALAVIAVPLVIATAWSDIPLTRSLATAALIMAASLLTPIKPVDGGAISAAGGTAAGITGIALAAVLALGLV